MNSPDTRVFEGRDEVFDIVRRRYVALTPEEWIRQQVVHHLHEDLNYPLELMSVEVSISVNRLSRRCDIVIYNKSMQPVMIVECKRPDVSVGQKTMDQACRYNLALNVPYLYLTNGIRHIVCRVFPGQHRVEPLSQLPSWEELSL